MTEAKRQNKSRYVWFRPTAEQLECVIREANDTGLSVSDIIRLAIRDRYSRQDGQPSADPTAPRTI